LPRSRFEREQPTSERLQAADPLRSGADSSEPAPLRAEVARLPPARSFPYLPRLGLGVVSRARPNTRCQYAPNASMTIRSVPSGSRAVSTPACEFGPFPRQPPPNRPLEPARPTSSERAPRARALDRRPSPSISGCRLPRVTGLRPPSLPAWPAPRPDCAEVSVAPSESVPVSPLDERKAHRPSVLLIAWRPVRPERPVHFLSSGPRVSSRLSPASLGALQLTRATVLQPSSPPAGRCRHVRLRYPRRARESTSDANRPRALASALRFGSNATSACLTC
jgi:hypothetical protein